MNKRYDINTLKSKIKYKLIVSIISVLIFIILLIISILLDKIWLALICIMFFLTTVFVGNFALADYVKLEKENHNIMIENYINKYEKEGNKKLSLIYTIYLNDIVDKLENLGIRSYVYLDINEEQLELDVIKNKKILKMIFDEQQVSYSIVQFKNKSITEEKWIKEKMAFSQESEIFDFILERYNNLS